MQRCLVVSVGPIGYAAVDNDLPSQSFEDPPVSKAQKSTSGRQAETLEAVSIPLVCDWKEGDPPHQCRFRKLTSFLDEVVDLDELVSACVAFVHSLVRAMRVRIWLYRRGGRRLVSREFDPHATDGFREFRLKPGQGLPWKVAELGKTWIGGPSADDPGFQSEDPGWNAALVVPLRRRGKILGVVECLDRADGNQFGSQEARALEEIGTEFALAIENAQLYHDTRRRAAERGALLEVTGTLARPLNLEDTLEAILDGLQQVVRYDAAAIYLFTGDEMQVETEATRGYPVDLRKGLQLLVGEGIVGWVAKSRESVIVADTEKDTRYVSARPSTRSEMATPMMTGGDVIGVFNLESDRVDSYTEMHLELLQAFAAQAAAAVERARLLDVSMERRNLERELGIARDIQTSFLPKDDPEVPGYEIAGLNLPYSEVGGDYFDFISVHDNQLGVAISDVAGKGIPASLLMAAYRASLLAEIRNQFTLRTIVAKVNSLLTESTDQGKFVTAFYGVLDTTNHVFTFVNAGHNPPILRRGDGTIEPLLDGGLALGILPDSRYEERPVSIWPGDILLLYTDGVSEAADPADSQFGTDRLEELLEELKDRSARQIVDAVLDRVIRFAGGPGELNDDLTVVCLKRLDEDPS
jgi:sigma-B regulation protein RsbU (phosphoserine phosphatase)